MNTTQKRIRKMSCGMKITTIVFYVLIGLQIALASVAVLWNEIDANFIFANYMTGEVISRMCAYIALCGFILGILVNFSRIFIATATDGHPFSKPNAGRLRRIGVIIIVASVVVPALEKSLLKVYAPESAAMVGDSLPFIILAIVFFFFSLLFYYGAELQQQSDETL